MRELQIQAIFAKAPYLVPVILPPELRERGASKKYDQEKFEAIRMAYLFEQVDGIWRRNFLSFGDPNCLPTLHRSSVGRGKTADKVTHATRFFLFYKLFGHNEDRPDYISLNYRGATSKTPARLIRELIQLYSHEKNRLRLLSLLIHTRISSKARSHLTVANRYDLYQMPSDIGVIERYIASYDPKPKQASVSA